MLENILESPQCHVIGAKKNSLWRIPTRNFLVHRILFLRAWWTPLWTIFSRLSSQSIPILKSNDPKSLSRDKDFQKKFLKWSENDELSEEYYSQTRSQLTVIPL